MAYCNRCGSYNDPEAGYCSACGTPLRDYPESGQMREETGYGPIPQGEQGMRPMAGPQEQPGYPGNGWQDVAEADRYRSQSEGYGSYPNGNGNGQDAAPPTKAKVCGIIGFVCGIWSVVFSWFGVIPISGLILGWFAILPGIAGIILTMISGKAGGFRLTKAGKILSIIGLSLSVVLWVIGLIVTIQMGALIDYTCQPTPPMRC